jgi:hypothetical protein
MVDYSDNLA